MNYDELKMGLEGPPDESAAYARGLLASGWTVTSMGDTLGITRQRMSQRLRSIGIDARCPEKVLPHKRCKVCGIKYWEIRNKTCGSKRCRSLAAVDMDLLCQTIRRIANDDSWKRVAREVWDQPEGNSGHVKERCVRWLCKLGFQAEAGLLALADRRKRPEVDDMFAARVRLRKLEQQLRKGKAI